MSKKYSKIWFIFKIAFLVVASFLLSQVITILIFAVANQFVDIIGLGDNFLQVIATLVSYVITFLIVRLIHFRMTKQKLALQDIGLNRLPSWQDILLVVPVFITYVLTSSFSVVLLNGLLPVFDADQKQQIGFTAFNGRLEYVYVFLLIAFLTPLFEEALFRGVFLRHLEKRISPQLAVVLVSLVFALLHIDWASAFQQFSWGLIFSHIVVDIFIFGLALGFLAKITGSIWASVLLHVLKNSVAFAVLFLFN